MMDPKRKMEIPAITEQQWEDRKKAKIFETIRDYFAYRAVFGEVLHTTTNAEFFINAIKILEDEIWGKNNESKSDL